MTTITTCLACDHLHDPASTGDCAAATCLPSCPQHGVDTNARPLAVVSVIGYCDAAPEHEHRLITTGERAYAYSPVDGAEPVGVHRDGVLLSFDCTQEHRGEPCHGRLEWRVDEQEWTADGDARTLLAQHGHAVER